MKTIDIIIIIKWNEAGSITMSTEVLLILVLAQDLEIP